MPIRKRRGFGKRRGTAAVEFAMVLVPVFSIVMGIIEGGRLMSVETIISNAAREGARLAVMSGSTMGSSSSTGVTEVNYRVREYLDAASVTSSAATITVTDLDNSSISDLTESSAGDRIKVTVSVPFSEVAWCTPWFFGKATPSMSCVMRKESP